MLIWCPTRDASWTYLWSWPVHGAEMKSASMSRADGWSYGELKMLPLSSFRALASIFQRIEDHKQWPACLSQWFLVLLRKTNIAVPTWADLRPITVAASLYRLWARVKFFATSPCIHGIWWHLLPSTQAVSYTPGPAESLGFSRTEVLVWFVLTYPPLPFGVLSLIFLDYPDHRKTQSGNPINLHYPLPKLLCICYFEFQGYYW